MEFLWVYFIVINLIGLLVMYRDKEKAKHGKYRIREATLWRIALIGGAVGTTLGMNIFRHKTKHINFKFGFPLLAIIDIAVVLYIFKVFG